VKPTLLGLPLGAFVGDAIARRATRALVAAAAATAALSGVAFVASAGAIFRDVASSNAQPFALGAWLEHVPERLPFFAPVFALAAFSGWRDRRAPGMAVGLGALGASIAWVLVALAKTGSASNYWMEPCIAAVAVVANAAPSAFRFGESGAAHAAIALGAVLWVDVASVRASIEHARDYRDDAAFVATIPAQCGGGVVAADEAGVELALDGRILVPTYQMAWLVRTGRFPAEPWARDLASPAVTCVVEHTGQLRLSPALVRVIDERFVPGREHGPWRVLVRRPSLEGSQIDPSPDR
jgi:hypothetical protein